jgi:hypothetical protein
MFLRNVSRLSPDYTALYPITPTIIQKMFNLFLYIVMFVALMVFDLKAYLVLRLYMTLV